MLNKLIYLFPYAAYGRGKSTLPNMGQSVGNFRFNCYYDTMIYSDHCCHLNCCIHTILRPLYSPPSNVNFSLFIVYLQYLLHSAQILEEIIIFLKNLVSNTYLLHYSLHLALSCLKPYQLRIKFTLIELVCEISFLTLRS